MAAEVSPDHLIVVLGSSAYDCVPVIKDCGVDIVVNPFWESGLAGSIRIGVERAEEQGADSVLLLAGRSALAEFRGDQTISRSD